MKTFIIAEAGVNHNGSYELAKQLIDVAHCAGADAVKFQTFRAEDLACTHAPKAEYQNRLIQDDVSQVAMLKSLELNDSAQRELQQYCKNKKILFLSSPFDLNSASFLNALNLPMIKIPSGEITNFPLLFKIAKADKSVILSTGMSTLGDIESALSILACGYLQQAALTNQSEIENCYYSELGQAILKEKVSLLHCVTEYPAPFYEVNLNAIKTLQTAFGLRVGYSDHTMGIAISLGAVALGATIIEKHFTLDKALPGPDHQASLSPNELCDLVKGIREVELALGNGQKIPAKSELQNRSIARKSIVALKTIKKGDILTDNNIGCKRPGSGITAAKFYSYINSCANRHYEPDELID